MRRKVRIKKAIYGRKVFNNKSELSYYKLYQQLKLQKELVMDVHIAVGKCEGYIKCDSAEEEIEAWQFLVDTGMAWKLQGWFGRQAQSMLDMGILKERNLQ